MASTNAPVNSSFFLSCDRDHAFRPTTFSNVTLLTGRETYDVWAATMEAVWRSLRLYELVIDGRKPEPGCRPEETDAYEKLYHQAVGIYIQVVGPDVLKQIIDLKDPHEMWKYLKSEYKRESSFALVFQLGKVMDLPQSSTSSSVSSLVKEFESEWLTLCKLAGDSTDEYRTDLGKCLSRDKAKRDFLLGLLSRRHKSVVNTLIARDDMSFAQVKQHLFDVDFNTSPQNSALVTKHDEPPVKSSQSKSRLGKQRVCSYCTKHYPSNANGHTWMFCRKMKTAKIKSRKSKSNCKSNEVANITTQSEKNDSFPLPYREGL